ncbi:hypothetical protein FR698_08805 [Pelomicrobium methylotrophicum]|uniref:Tc1-like transposase DDE domain-containing protein n=1 Tax=Pelomicrobium methylotrophicum TaxID=2602750 RepID=A0A5C7EIK9_9PROT|nr:hypothetical protein FR698_08805 [Pelomicrobium methylotrophicum]
MDAQAGTPADRETLRHQVQRGPCLAHSGGDGLFQPEAREARHRARRGGRRALEEAHLASAQKKARREGPVIVFIDESGLSERPTRVRTWAPRGQTPVIQFHFNWKQLSMIAGVSFTNAYFRLHEGSIKGPQIVEFLR